MENSNPQIQPHIVIVPSPGMGHLIPLVEFAKLLHSRHHFSISILLPSSSPPTSTQTALLSTLPSAISHTFLPPIDPSLLPSAAANEVIIHLTHLHSLPSFRFALSSLPRVSALVTDLFGSPFFDFARELSIPPYIYFTTNAFCLLFFIHLPNLHEKVSCEYRDMPDPLVLPGCVPLHGRDFVEPAQDRNDETYRVLLYHVKRYGLAEGILINTFFELEPGPVQALQADDCPNRTEIYPVGPVIQSGLRREGNEGSLECLSWLDRQPPGSVLFVSFGSGGTLSLEQINELAIGLEKSGQRFLWVVRGPSQTSSGSFFTQSTGDPYGFLPNGFVDRIKGRGLLVPSWAPQIRVLGHTSTGGFLTHCGWNSTLESIVYGVPLIAWPLYAEQRMNAVLLNEGLKVALRPKAREGGFVEADEIAKVVKDLMVGEEGKRARQQMKELSDAAKKAMAEDGDSTRTLGQVAHKWRQSIMERE